MHGDPPPPPPSAVPPPRSSAAREDLKGKHILVTAGPTHEPIDPVRVIANRSSGRQGYAIAAAAAEAGARVTLVSGPVALDTPAGVDRIDIETAGQMADHLEMVFEATGSRGGFMLGHTVSMPGDLVAIVDLLVPELQRRGRFRTEYTGRTLRENLGD